MKDLQLALHTRDPSTPGSEVAYLGYVRARVPRTSEFWGYEGDESEDNPFCTTWHNLRPILFAGCLGFVPGTPAAEQGYVTVTHFSVYLANLQVLAGELDAPRVIRPGYALRLDTGALRVES